MYGCVWPFIRSHFGSRDQSKANPCSCQHSSIRQMSSSRDKMEPAPPTGWVPAKKHKEFLMPQAPPVQGDQRSSGNKRLEARQNKPPAKRLHKQGPEVHARIQAAVTKAASPSASQSNSAAGSSSSEDVGSPVIGKPSWKDLSDQAKLDALIAARDCQKCQWTNKKTKGCPECMGFMYQRMRLTTHNLQLFQEKLGKHDQD